jgi:hypothetical protein
MVCKPGEIGNIHQNILVFVKGNPVKAAAKCTINMQELEDALTSETTAEAQEATV